MQSSKALTIKLGLLLGLIVSIIPAKAEHKTILNISQKELVEAFVEAFEKTNKQKTCCDKKLSTIEKIKKLIKLLKTPQGIIGATIAGISVPYLINYMIRKPLKEKRFDAKKLISKDFFKHVHYFIADYMLGWPPKSSKVTFNKGKDGEVDVQFKDGQLAGGGFGKLNLYLLLIGKALNIPGLVTKSIDDCADGLENWMAVLAVE